MKVHARIGVILGFVAVLLLGVAIGMSLNNPVSAQKAEEKADAKATPHYTVVATEGTNLIVTDNQTNTLYFYTIEPDGKPGDELVLRGKADLNQVGQDKMKPTLVNPRKPK